MEIIINYWAVLGATVAAVALGALWYGPLFGKYWMKLVGQTPETMRAMEMTPAASMAWSVVTSFLMAYVLAHGILFGNAYLGTSGIGGGLQGAFWYWLGFAVPLTSSVYLYEGKSVKLWVLNAAYYLVTFLAMGALLGVWG